MKFNSYPVLTILIIGIISSVYAIDSNLLIFDNFTNDVFAQSESLNKSSTVNQTPEDTTDDIAEDTTDDASDPQLDQTDATSDFGDAEISTSSSSSIDSESTNDAPTRTTTLHEETKKKDKANQPSEKANVVLEEKSSFPTRSHASEHSKKIHSNIIRIMDDPEPKKTAELFRANYNNEKLGVYIYLKPGVQNKPNIEILDEYENTLYARLPFNQIQAVANSNSVLKITLPVLAETRVSEGVSFSMADDMHTAGITGNGTVVAVIDDSFYIDNIEIAPNVLNATFGAGCDFANLTCWDLEAIGLPPITPTNSHGTAVAEIVVDMAPDVKLRLFAIKNNLDVKQAVDDIIANFTDVDIITMSLGFPGLGGDGTNSERWYRDGTSDVAKKVNEASNATNQKFVTVAAGNQGISHWMGNYSAINVTSTFPDQLDFQICPGCYDTVMNFNSSAPGDMKACLPIESGIDFVRAAWNDWGTPGSPTQDYDTYLYFANMTAPEAVSASTDPQVDGFDPIEVFLKIENEPMCLVVASWDDPVIVNTKDHLFHIESGGVPIEPSFRKLGSLDTPADARDAFTVGAINHATGLREDFSSQGPTDDGRTKPEICGPDGTTSSMIGPLNPFFGTSASTPHVAAAAALLLEQNPSLDVSQLKQKLIDDASSGVFSVDNKCGSNSGSLRLVLDSTITVTKTAIDGDGVFDFTTTVTDDTRDGNFTGNDGFSINTSVDNTVTFTGLSPDLNYTITESAEPGWQLDTLSCTGGANTLTSGTTVTLDPNPGEQIDCTYTNSIPPPCSPPPSGDWTVNSSCTMTGNETINNGNLIVQNNSVLTIPAGIILDIDFANHNLTVKFGSGVLIKSGGAIT